MNFIFTVGKSAANGTYTGDGTVNKAIPHGLGRVPSNVLIRDTTNTKVFAQVGQEGFIADIGTNYLAVTAMDATNFYVGNATSYTQSANAAVVYYWSAS